jgi:hypothetical protein
MYPDLYYWTTAIPDCVRISIYRKYGRNIKFEFIPEYTPPDLYFILFGKFKGYHYPTDDDIKFFYFTLFKKNGFLFLIVCCIIYRNCLLEIIILVIQSGIAFYIILDLIYLILLLRKNIKLFFILNRRGVSKPTLIIFIFNHFLNFLFNYNYKIKIIWYF